MKKLVDQVGGLSGFGLRFLPLRLSQQEVRWQIEVELVEYGGDSP